MRKRLTKAEMKEALHILHRLYPDAVSELNFSSPFECLIATMLSAQTTDKRVNIVTSQMFKQYNTPESFLTLSEKELGDMIKTIGFYKTKSKNILKTCEILIHEYDAKVPDTQDELVKLPGVGRKTANVVVSNVYGKDAIAVDTHVFRVSNRIGLASSDDVDGTEKDLMKRIPKEDWSDAHHWLIYHGRRVCKARKPQCDNCPLTDICLYYKNNLTGKK